MSGDVLVALLGSEWRLRRVFHPSTSVSVEPLPSTQFSFQTMLDSCPWFTTFQNKEPVLVCPPTVTRETDCAECGVCVTCACDCALGPLGPLVLSDAPAPSLPLSLSFQVRQLFSGYFGNTGPLLVSVLGFDKSLPWAFCCYYYKHPKTAPRLTLLLPTFQSLLLGGDHFQLQLFFSLFFGKYACTSISSRSLILEIFFRL